MNFLLIKICFGDIHSIMSMAFVILDNRILSIKMDIRMRGGKKGLAKHLPKPYSEGEVD